MCHTVVSDALWKHAVSKKTASLHLIKTIEKRLFFSQAHLWHIFSFCSDLSVVCGDLWVVKHFEYTTEKLWQQPLRLENNNNKSTCAFMEIVRNNLQRRYKSFFSLQIALCWTFVSIVWLRNKGSNSYLCHYVNQWKHGQLFKCNHWQL